MRNETVRPYQEIVDFEILSLRAAVGDFDGGCLADIVSRELSGSGRHLVALPFTLETAKTFIYERGTTMIVVQPTKPVRAFGRLAALGALRLRDGRVVKDDEDDEAAHQMKGVRLERQ